MRNKYTKLAGILIGIGIRALGIGLIGASILCGVLAHGWDKFGSVPLFGLGCLTLGLLTAGIADVLG